MQELVPTHFDKNAQCCSCYRMHSYYAISTEIPHETQWYLDEPDTMEGL
jgi:hypothetical protein